MTNIDGPCASACTTSGPGIPENFRNRIFGRFAQADIVRTTRQKGGTGLGLAICKRLLEMMAVRSAFRIATAAAPLSGSSCRKQS
jgi:K+-sensing histidine kinase KdpD